MTYRVVMSVVYVPSPMFSISLLAIHPLWGVSFWYLWWSGRLFDDGELSYVVVCKTKTL